MKASYIANNGKSVGEFSSAYTKKAQATFDQVLGHQQLSYMRIGAYSVILAGDDRMLVAERYDEVEEFIQTQFHCGKQYPDHLRDRRYQCSRVLQALRNKPHAMADALRAQIKQELAVYNSKK